MLHHKKTSPLRISSTRTALAPQEKLVNDVRAGLTPSQLVEQKLISLLRSTILPTSHLQVSRVRRALS
jgi:hypothetical protein